MFVVSDYIGYGTYSVWDSRDNTNTAILKDELLFLARFVKIKGVNINTGEIDKDAKVKLVNSQSAKAKLLTGDAVDIQLNRDNDEVYISKQVDNGDELRIPEFTTMISSKMIKNHRLLRKVYLPESLTLIEADTFSWDRDLEEVVGLNNVKGIKARAFSSTGIRKVYLTGDKKLGGSIFSNSAVEDVYMSTPYVGAGMFCNCRNLRKLKLDGVKIIKDRAFGYSGAGIEELDLGDDIESIGEKAFYAAKIINDVAFIEPKNNKRLGKACFTMLSAKYIELNDIDKELSDKCFYAVSCEVRNLEHVTKVGDSCFCNASGNKELIFSDRLQEVGAKAFSYCNAETIYLGKNCKKIGNGAFLGAKVTHIDLPEDVELSIGTFSGSDVKTVSYRGNNDIVLCILAQSGVRIV